MSTTFKTIAAAVLLAIAIPSGIAAQQQQPAPRPSGHFCIETQQPDGRIVPVCRCNGLIDCRRVVPVCTAALLASDPNAEKLGRCARR